MQKKQQNQDNYVIVSFLLICAFLVLPFQVIADDQESEFEYGFQHRARYISRDNVTDYDDNADDKADYFRFRTRVWADWTPSSTINLRLQLTNEFRPYITPDKDDTFHEVFVEHCYVRLNNLFDTGWSASIGRQDIMRGEGMILFDGGPLDGSRSAYFNAVIASYAFSDSKLEFIGISNPAEDKYFPRINDQDQALIEWDEKAIGAYYTSNHFTDSTIEGYYLFKKEDHSIVGDRQYHVLGGRLSHAFESNWSVTSEIAAEYWEGDQDYNIVALAGYTNIKRAFQGSMKPYFIIGFAAFSGDDPDTAEDESWNPPFSRWTKWSSEYSYSFAKETYVAWWSNLLFGKVELGLQPMKSIQACFSYYYMDAFTNSNSDSMVFAEGKHRGSNIQGRIDFDIVKGLKGHAMYEYHIPGDFYLNDSAGYFLRFELKYQFSKRI